MTTAAETLAQNVRRLIGMAVDLDDWMER